MSQILDMFIGKYDIVVIDSPPIGVVIDPMILAAKADATLFVVESKRTKLGAAVQAVEQMRRADANLIGMVFNNVPLKSAGYYTGYYSGYYYQYAYSYGEDGRGPDGSKKKRKSRLWRRKRKAKA